MPQESPFPLLHALASEFLAIDIQATDTHGISLGTEEKNAVLDDNRPASVEGHNVISQALPRHLGKGLDVKSREGRG